MGIPNIINCGKCVLKPVNSQNVGIVNKLFQNADVKKYYVLRADHARNINSFGQYLIDSNNQHKAMNFVIENNQGSSVGIITAEAVMNQATNLPMWNVGYAILPDRRRNGYA